MFEDQNVLKLRTKDKFQFRVKVKELNTYLIQNRIKWEVTFDEYGGSLR